MLWIMTQNDFPLCSSKNVLHKRVKWDLCRKWKLRSVMLLTTNSVYQEVISADLNQTGDYSRRWLYSENCWWKQEKLHTIVLLLQIYRCLSSSLKTYAAANTKPVFWSAFCFLLPMFYMISHETRTRLIMWAWALQWQSLTKTRQMDEKKHFCLP